MILGVLQSMFYHKENDPINHIDPNGHAWYHWAIGVGIIVLCGALTVVTVGGFAAAGTAFASVVTATMAPTAASAIFAGAFVGATAIGVAGMAIGGRSGDDIADKAHGIRIGLDGNPLPGQGKLPPGARKALKKLWELNLKALSK